MAAAVRYRRLAKPAQPAAQWPATAATKLGDVFGFLALVQQRRHLPEAARAAFGDRVFSTSALRPAGGRDVVADAHVEVRADAPDRLDRGQRVADACRCARTVRGPSARSAFRCTPPTAALALCSPLCASTSAGTISPKANTSTTPSVTARWPAFDSVCSDSRAPRGPPRIATKNTPRPRTTQKRMNRDDHAAREDIGWRRRTVDASSSAVGWPMRALSPLGALKLRR